MSEDKEKQPEAQAEVVEENSESVVSEEETKEPVYAGGFLAFKLGMTQVYKDGEKVPVTVLHASKNVCTALRTVEKNGYQAVQVGIKPKKPQLLNKAVKGFYAKNKIEPLSHLKEFRLEDTSALKIGEASTVDTFKVGDLVTIKGISKGKGFQGVFKRYGFSGGRKTHGSRFHRAPGSIGMCEQPGKVYKGRKMPGRTGNYSVTYHNIEVIDVDLERELLVLKGAVPGAKQSLVEIRKIV